MIKLHGSHLKTLEKDIYGGPSHVDSLFIMNPPTIRIPLLSNKLYMINMAVIIIIIKIQILLYMIITC